MTAAGKVNLAPVPSDARIDLLDILRGIAILGIFYINTPYMAASIVRFSADVRLIGWTPLDRGAWAAVNLMLAGTQRCLLEFLFGAGMMILARKAMTPQGSVAVADLYLRRNLWLLAFGLFDVFVLLWPGDILHVYAVAAMFLFPFRLLGPRVLLVLGLGWAVLSGLGIPENGVRGYVARTEMVEQARDARAQVAAGHAPTAEERDAMSRVRDMAAAHVPDPALLAQEAQAHRGGWLGYAIQAWRRWVVHVDTWLIWDVYEAFCTMLIGIALWKWGIIQGERSTRFYAGLLVAGYGFGLAARGIGLAQALRFEASPSSLWITGEAARLAIGLGHLALVNLIVRWRAGGRMLRMFRAPGRMAFSLYFLQQLAGMYVLFAPWGVLPWAHYGWAAMALVTTIGVAVLVVAANLWMRYFVSGPLEWLWRSLSYLRWQKLRRT